MFHYFMVFVVLALLFLPGILPQIANKKHQMAITWLCLIPLVGWISAWVWFFFDEKKSVQAKS